MNQAHLDLCNSDEWAEVIRDQVVPWVLDGIQLGGRVLEIGSGPGRTTDVIHVLAELARVVRPGGWTAGEDSRPSDDLRDFHDGDTYVPIDPDTLPERLTAAGWRDIEVVTNEFATRFRGTAPL